MEAGIEPPPGAEVVGAADFSRITIAHNPNSNQKLGSGMMDLVNMMGKTKKIALGTDGAASNNRLDLLGEGRLAGLLAKVVADDATAFDAHQVLRALTLGGATAVGLGERIGSIEVGKAADLVAVDLSPLEYGPILDPVATLIHTGGREAVTDVWIDGQLVVTGRQFTSQLSRQAVGTVVGRNPLWHNRLGEFVSGRVG